MHPEETIAKTSLEVARNAARILFAPDQVVELRALGLRYTTSGYYDDHDLLAAHTIQLAANPEYHGVYWTLQRLNPALLARSRNKYRERARETTSDPDVTAFRWLLIDVDPQRPAGISSSNSEKLEAMKVTERVRRFFRTDVSYEPGVGDSGNGYHVLVRVDLPAEDKGLVQRVLEALSARFSTPQVKIDRSVFNPARISKAYGTVARKGENVPDRPHRAASLLHVPANIVAIDRSFLEKLASEVKETKSKSNAKKGNPAPMADPLATVERFLAEGGIKHGGRREFQGDGTKWELKNCPFNSSHAGTSVVVTVGPDGAFGFRCMHNSCLENHWNEFRSYVEEKLGHSFAFTEVTRSSNPDGILTDPGCVSEMTVRSEQVLQSIGLKYFERNNELVHTAFARDLPKLQHVDRAEDSVLIQEASHQTIIRDLDRRATYRATMKDGPRDVHVPSKLPEQIKSRVKSEVRAVPFPTLRMVTGSPVLLPSGTVTTRMFEDGVLYVPSGVQGFASVPERPKRQEAIEALNQFDEIFGKFPFVDPFVEDREWKQTASYAVALSGVLSLVARPYIGLGAIPLIASNASTQRSGKTKLVEAISASALGHKPTVVAFSDEEELGKHLVPLMRSGDRAILIDNVERTLQSTRLNILITNGVLRARILGESNDVVLHNYAVLFATGNNLTIGGDLTVRSLRCDIDAKLERPEARGFEFDPVKRAIERHPQVVVAALTALRAYVVAGSPWSLKRKAWGGFETWDQLVCGCLTWLGYSDPHESRDRVIGADPIRSENVDLLMAWHKQYGGRVVSFADIRKDGGEVYEALLKDQRWDGYHARWVLRRLEGKICDGYRLAQMSGRSRYRVEKVDEPRGTCRCQRRPEAAGPEPDDSLNQDMPF